MEEDANYHSSEDEDYNPSGQEDDGGDGDRGYKEPHRKKHKSLKRFFVGAAVLSEDEDDLFGESALWGLETETDEVKLTETEAGARVRAEFAEKEVAHVGYTEYKWRDRPPITDKPIVAKRKLPWNWLALHKKQAKTQALYGLKPVNRSTWCMSCAVQCTSISTWKCACGHYRTIHIEKSEVATQVGRVVESVNGAKNSESVKHLSSPLRVASRFSPSISSISSPKKPLSLHIPTSPSASFVLDDLSPSCSCSSLLHSSLSSSSSSPSLSRSCSSSPSSSRSCSSSPSAASRRPSVITNQALSTTTQTAAVATISTTATTSTTAATSITSTIITVTTATSTTITTAITSTTVLPSTTTSDTSSTTVLSEVTTMTSESPAAISTTLTSSPFFVPPSPRIPLSTASSSSVTPVRSLSSLCAPLQLEESPSNPHILTYQEPVEYAGSTLNVTRVVRKGSKEEHNLRKRDQLDLLVQALGATPKKLTSLEKSQLDWTESKNEEGDAEKLREWTLSREGFRNKQKFLEDTDARVFELEKAGREQQRSVMAKLAEKRAAAKPF